MWGRFPNLPSPSKPLEFAGRYIQLPGPLEELRMASPEIRVLSAFGLKLDQGIMYTYVSLWPPSAGGKRAGTRGENDLWEVRASRQTWLCRGMPGSGPESGDGQENPSMSNNSSDRKDGRNRRKRCQEPLFCGFFHGRPSGVEEGSITVPDTFSSLFFARRQGSEEGRTQVVCGEPVRARLFGRGNCWSGEAFVQLANKDGLQRGVRDR